MSSEYNENYYCIIVETGKKDERTGKPIKYFSTGNGFDFRFERYDAAKSLSEGHFSLEELDGITSKYKDQTFFLANYFDDEEDLSEARVYVYQIIKNKERPVIYDSQDTRLFCARLESSKRTRQNDKPIDTPLARTDNFSLMCHGYCYINRLVDLIFRHRDFLETKHKELDLYNIDLIRTVILRDSAYVEYTKKKRSIATDFGETTPDIENYTRQTTCSYEVLRDLFVLLNKQEKECDKYYLRRDYMGQVAYWDFKRGVLVDARECFKETDEGPKSGLRMIEGISLAEMDSFTSFYYNDLQFEGAMHYHMASKGLEKYYPRFFHRIDFGDMDPNKKPANNDPAKPVFTIETTKPKFSKKEEERLMPIFGKHFQRVGIDPEKFIGRFDSYGVYVQDIEAIEYERCMPETMALQNLLYDLKNRIAKANDMLYPTTQPANSLVMRNDWIEYASYRKLRELFNKCLSLESICTANTVKRYNDETVNINAKLTLFPGDKYNRNNSPQQVQQPQQP